MIEIFGFSIAEPTTVFTDLILAGMSFYFGHVLYWHAKYHGKNNSYGRRYSQFWGIVFLFLGFASFLGAVAHGVPHMSGEYPILRGAWPFTVMCMGMVSFYLLLTIAMEYFPRQRNIIFILAYIKVMAFLSLMFGYPKKYFGEFQNVSFNLVILDYAPIMLLLLALNIKDIIKKKSPAAQKMVMGIVVSILGTAVQMSGFTIHQHFNHNDIYHVIQMVAITLMFKAVLRKKII